ncbi:beta-ketoacyl synthase N-terminal-like domain-containing protein [Marinimicrobium sp. ARAG 43.8]|uniref:beta-ketoacyl synthase N-terminal-like domain-containing protein n=1 Tax=Marinimicrobium sp. ARAG 43.8 TaxID=3418719 RepID=UPI003CF355E6
MPTYIHNLDAHCALGPDLNTGVDALLAGRNALSSVPLEWLCEPLCLPYFSMSGSPISDGLYHYLEQRCEHLLQSRPLKQAGARQRTALLIGSSSFDVGVSEQRYRSDLAQRSEQALPMPIIGYGKLTQRLREHFGLSPLSQTYSTACTSSSNALLYGHRMIQAGLVDHALVLGLECFNNTSLLGFYSLGLISPSQAMRPFARARDGLILGEGLGAVVLSREPLEPHRPQWQLLGGASGTDNHSLTAAHTDGRQLARVISEALANSHIEVDALVGIKLHGTASLKNDASEAAAVRHLLGEHCPAAFALKPWVGHTLGACGALELALTLGCLERQGCPARPDITPDPELAMPLAETGCAAPEGPYLFNCFAFGGNNNALIVDHRQPPGGHGP